jgi:GntR family transcriptional regulator of arabinose operon
MITEHLLKLGCRRIAFLVYSNSASTVAAPVAGYREALFVFGVPVEPALVQSLDTGEEDEVRHLMEMLKPESLVRMIERRGI